MTIEKLNVNNPAARLHSFLRGIVDTKPSAPVVVAWGQAFGIPHTETNALSLELVLLYGLVDQTRSLLTNIPHHGRQQRFTRALDGIEKGLSASYFNLTFDNIAQYISRENLVNLEYISDELDIYNEQDLKPEDLKYLSTIVGELHEAIVASSIEVTLRVKLLEQLDRIAKALSIYRVLGAKGIGDALNALLGILFTNAKELKQIGAKEPGLVKKLSDTVDAISNIVTKVSKIYKALPSRARESLGWDGVSSDSDSANDAGVSEPGDNGMEA